ncbi:hypothetical protein ACIOGX_00340 [Streptomyces sp. NPDC088147]|uniref:hypothetical protein n=1 Tax=unclassified Streptomyces TaxID=2593676 RepID=UPI0033ABD53F
MTDNDNDGTEERRHAYRQYLAEQQADCPTPPATQEELDAERDTKSRSWDRSVAPW